MCCLCKDYWLATSVRCSFREDCSMFLDVVAKQMHSRSEKHQTCFTGADGITLGSDIKGVSGVKDYFQAYIDKYDFEHEVITGAVDEKANVTFSFWQDKVRVADRSDHLYR